MCIEELFDLARFFFRISEHADSERRGPVADLKVPHDASHRDLSDATLRSDLALGVHRRHAPKNAKNRSEESGIGYGYGAWGLGPGHGSAGCVKDGGTCQNISFFLVDRSFITTYTTY